MPTGRRAHEEANQLWAKFTDHVERGATTHEACAKIGRSYSSYLKRRVAYPDWAAKLDSRATHWDRFAALVADGMSIAGALEAIGRSHNAYQTYRNRHPEWAAKIDSSRGVRYEKANERGGARPVQIEKQELGFVEFRRAYLGMDTTWFQLRAAQAIESARPGEVTMVLWPPQHGKSTLLADWCTYKIATDPSFRITVASETVNHSKKMLQRVRQRLEADGPCPRIVSDFGPFMPENDRSQVWGQLSFNVQGKKQSDEQDFNMHAIGLGGSVQGTRADLMLLDDVQGLESLERTDKYYDMIVQDFLSRPGMEGRTVIIGTRVGEFDVYRKLIENGIVYTRNLVRIPAYKVSESPLWLPPKIINPGTVHERVESPPEGIEFIWPEKYAPEDYATMRHRVGEKAWWRNYMQRPEAAASMTFSEELTDKIKDDLRSVLHDPKPDAGESKVPVVIALDPAIESGNGVLAAGMHKQWMAVHNARLDFGLTSTRQILSVVEEECHRWTTPTSFVMEVVIEDKAFQRGLLRDDQLIEMQRQFGFRIVPNTTGKEKSDPDIGVPAIEHSMLRAEITIPWADEASQKAMYDFLRHLHMWRPGVAGNKLEQDLVMTLWFAWRRWRKFRDTPLHHRGNTEQFRHRGSPLRSRHLRSIA